MLGRVADKWTVLIVGCLAKRTYRFGELRREVNGISQKMLTQTLRALERDGLVARRVYASVPPKVEYSLTPLGRSLVGILEEVRAWVKGNMSKIKGAQTHYDQSRDNSEGR
ncbi:MAG: helix-turn-helix domain-containing protein [Gammaproteobacteria bacterium]